LRLFAQRNEIFEPQIVEQLQPHRVDGEHCIGNAAPSVVPGAVSLLPSLPRTAICRSANPIAFGSRPTRAWAAFQGPSSVRRRLWPTRTNRRSPRPTRRPSSRSAATRSSTVTRSPGSGHEMPRTRGMSSQRRPAVRAAPRCGWSGLRRGSAASAVVRRHSRLGRLQTRCNRTARHEAGHGVTVGRVGLRTCSSNGLHLTRPDATTWAVADS
jgi:hypothetical protein